MKKIKRIAQVEIKALIFDVGGVLFLPKNNKQEKHLLSSFRELCLLLKDFEIDTAERQKELLEIYMKSSRGDISKEETINLMSKELNISPRKTEESFNAAYENNTIENIVLYDYILQLKNKGYKIGILSTQFHLSKDILIPKKYYKTFDSMEISCDDKLRKPDVKAFELILQRLKVKPEEAVFIDDKEENIDAAEKLGMKAILFKDNKDFFSCLDIIMIKY